MPEARLEEKKIKYDVRESERASRSRIDVDLDGVTVVIPKGRDLDPEEFLQDKKDWVLEKQKQMEDYWARIPEREFEEGETFPYLGESHELKISSENCFDVVEGQILIPEKKAEKLSIKEAIDELYRKKAREKVKEIIDQYSEKIDTDYDKLFIRNQKTKWASCSSKNNLNFNWRLMMAPEKVLEYVVVHELLHLKEPNHSKSFWTQLGEIMPDYRERREWLKENSPELVFSEEDVL